MRELGQRLQVKAASLYNHIAGKDELLGGMVELVMSEIEVPTDGVSWKESMRRRAISARQVFARHIWAAALTDARDRTGPNSLSYVDRVLGVLIQGGFSPAAAANASLILDSYIYGFERQRPDALRLRTGRNAPRWLGRSGGHPRGFIPVRGTRGA